MIITIEDCQRNNMLKVLLIILSSGILAITGGCAHVTIEKRSVPSFSPWDGDVDTNIYFPDDIGVRREIINEHIELDFLWDNYTTEYRGLKVLGIEVVREPDAINASGYIVLKLGVKNISYNEILKFKPGGVLFSVERINDGVVKVLSPKVVYQQDSALFCSFDYDLKSWGGKSKEVSDGDVVVIEKNNKDFYECFNLIYYIDFNNENQKGYLNFDGALLPLDEKIIYFHPKKIRWIQSN